MLRREEKSGLTREQKKEGLVSQFTQQEERHLRRQRTERKTDRETAMDRRPETPGMAAPVGNDRVRDLQSEVEGVKNIMSENVERILARGENLDQLRNKTEDLEASSEHFKTTSQKVARKYWWKNAKMIAIICVIVGIIVLLIILLATGVIPT
ncbi:vesicle-associated membrane protein 8 [Aquarana catesbeiana]